MYPSRRTRAYPSRQNGTFGQQGRDRVGQEQSRGYWTHRGGPNVRGGRSEAAPGRVGGKRLRHVLAQCCGRARGGHGCRCRRPSGSRSDRAAPGQHGHVSGVRPSHLRGREFLQGPAMSALRANLGARPAAQGLREPGRLRQRRRPCSHADADGAGCRPTPVGRGPLCAVGAAQALGPSGVSSVPGSSSGMERNVLGALATIARSRSSSGCTRVRLAAAPAHSRL